MSVNNNKHNLDILNQVKLYTDDNAYTTGNNVTTNKKESEQLGVDKNGKLYIIKYDDNYGIFKRVKRFFKRRFGDQRISLVKEKVIEALNTADNSTKLNLQFKIKALAGRIKQRNAIGSGKAAAEIEKASEVPEETHQQKEPPQLVNETTADTRAQTVAALGMNDVVKAPDENTKERYTSAITKFTSSEKDHEKYLAAADIILNRNQVKTKNGAYYESKYGSNKELEKTREDFFKKRGKTTLEKLKPIAMKLAKMYIDIDQ
jgi:hypothetical protein